MRVSKTKLNIALGLLGLEMAPKIKDELSINAGSTFIQGEDTVSNKTEDLAVNKLSSRSNNRSGKKKVNGRGRGGGRKVVGWPFLTVKILLLRC
ncbi:hypothetical protein CASFOL_008095 [Castilleja foliolosa]|uniref:Uncharacterized protein n=1 Tax=Castilleja foliolosa TaxID=1961234 RepID=A0ABD3DYI7_9LAMI